MSFYVGTGSTIQIGKETTFGTAATMTDLVNFTSESINTTVDKGDEGSLLASKTATNRDLMAINVGGSISYILRPEFAGLLFHAALGGADTVTSSGSLYKHTMKLAAVNADLPSLTITVDRKAACRAYAGCTISSLSLEAAAGDYVKGSFDIVGQSEAAGTLASLDAYTVPSYRCTSATFSFGGSSLDISNCTITVDNALETAPKTYASGLYAGQPQHGQRNISVSFEIPYSSAIETLRSTYLTTETNAAVVLTFASSNSNYTCTITIPNVAINSVENNVSGAGVITASIGGEALSVGSTEPITVEIVDDNSGAYGA